MKATLNLTHRCRPCRTYRDSGKPHRSDMPLSTAKKSVDLAFRMTPPGEKTEIGFFDGEPLLRFGLIREIARYIHDQEEETGKQASLSLTTNGTMLTERVIQFVHDENVDLCTTNTDNWVEQACRTSLACDGVDDPTTAELSDCMDTMHGDGNVLICFEPSIIATLTACVENAIECNPSPIPHCAMEIVGLELGNSGHNP